MTDIPLEPAPTVTAAPPTGELLGTGRRKTSIARVRLRPGNGQVRVNQRELEQYFTIEQDRKDVLAPLLKSGLRDQFDVHIRVSGGGTSGQAGACQLGIARALKNHDAALSDTLRDAGHLTRDGRMKERKKYGLRGARRGTQFSKR